MQVACPDEERCRHFDVDINYKDNAFEILDLVNVE